VQSRSMLGVKMGTLPVCSYVEGSIGGISLCTRVTRV
jgi:hypothetical protein